MFSCHVTIFSVFLELRSKTLSNYNFIEIQDFINGFFITFDLDP